VYIRAHQFKPIWHWRIDATAAYVDVMGFIVIRIVVCVALHSLVYGHSVLYSTLFASRVLAFTVTYLAATIVSHRA